MTYEVAPGRTEGNGLLRQTLYPPTFPEEVLVHPVRWAVALPTGWVPLASGEAYTAEQRWGLRGWQLVPRPAYSPTDLEEWFEGGPASASPAEAEVGWVCRGPALQPLPLLVFPQQQIWQLGCSLAFLLAGLVLGLAPLPRGLFWLALAGLVAVLVPVGLVWPSALRAFVFGCQMGAVVLLLALGVHWMLQRRYRRQVVFLPGFSRLKTNSSLIRTGSSSRLREPSTVDAAPPGDAAVDPSPRPNG
jgi:hypothetical protein